MNVGCWCNPRWSILKSVLNLSSGSKYGLWCKRGELFRRTDDERRIVIDLGGSIRPMLGARRESCSSIIDMTGAVGGKRCGWGSARHTCLSLSDRVAHLLFVAFRVFTPCLMRLPAIFSERNKTAAPARNISGGLPTSSTTITASSLNILAFFFSETISFEQKVNRSIVIIQSLRAKKSCCCARCVEQKSERVEWGPYVLSFGGS